MRSLEQTGTRQRVGVAGRAEKQFDPNGIMNTGTIYPIEK